jgi:serine/threonine protein phosphatase PrpC
MYWCLVAASCVGSSHIVTGAPCQDSFGAELFEAQNETVLLAIVSDGAGSAAHSEVGSSKAVETTRRLVRGFLSSHEVASIDRTTAEDWLLSLGKPVRGLFSFVGEPQHRRGSTRCVNTS